MVSLELSARMLILPFSGVIPRRLLEYVPGFRFCGLLVLSSSLLFTIISSVGGTGTLSWSTLISLPLLLSILLFLFVRFIDFYGRSLWDVQKQLYDEYLYCFALLFTILMFLSVLLVLLGPILPGIVFTISYVYLLVVAVSVIKVLAEVSLIKSLISLILGLLLAIPLACYILDLYLNIPFFMRRIGA